MSLRRRPPTHPIALQVYELRELAAAIEEEASRIEDAAAATDFEFRTWWISRALCDAELEGEGFVTDHWGRIGREALAAGRVADIELAMERVLDVAHAIPKDIPGARCEFYRLGAVLSHSLNKNEEGT